jgi:Protein of unknown function with HXXEE motif
MISDGIIDLLVPSVIAIISILIFFLVHPAQKFFFVPAMVVAFICYLRTSYREMPKAERVLPVYLLALAVQFLHFTEEYVYGFHQRLTEIMAGWPPFNVNVFVAFNMIAYSLFLVSGLAMYGRMKFPMIIVWFFVIAAVVGNAILHPLLAIRVGGYFPGLFTSFAYWILAPILLTRLWNQGNNARAS